MGKINKLGCFAFARNDVNALNVSTSYRLNVFKKVAFTLAEVLITLGIIGVVAALTMPTLVANIQDKVLETQRSKAKNILVNGYKKLMADNEVLKLSETSLSSCSGVDCIKSEHTKIFKTLESSLGNGKLPTKYIDKDGNELDMDWSNKYIFITPDGYVYGLDVDAFLSEKKYNIYTDINGLKNPNKEKKDLILYTISDEGKIAEADISNKECSWDDLAACNEEQCNALPRKRIDSYSVYGGQGLNGALWCKGNMFSDWSGSSCTGIRVEDSGDCIEDY